MQLVLNLGSMRSESRASDECDKIALAIYSAINLGKSGLGGKSNHYNGIYFMPPPTSFRSVRLKDYNAIADQLKMAVQQGGQELAQLRLNAFMDTNNNVHFVLSHGTVPFFDSADNYRKTPRTKILPNAIEYKVGEGVIRFRLVTSYSYSVLRSMAGEMKK